MEQTNSERAAEARRTYQKAWRAKNKDRVREYNRRFWEKKAEQQAEIDEKTNSEN